MHKLEEIYTELGKTNGEMVADLQTIISGLRNESANRRVALSKVLDALGVSNDDKADENISNISRTLEALRNTGVKPDKVGEQLSELKKQLGDLTSKYEAAEKKAEAEKAARVNASIKAAAIDALTKGNALNPAEMAKLVSDRIKPGDDDKLTFTGDDGKAVSVADGVKNWLKANPWAVKNTGNGGAGTSGKGADKPEGTKYTLDDVKKMTPEEINKHWDEVRKVMNAEKE